MAATVAKLEAYLSANTRDFDRDIDRSDKHFSKVGGAIGKTALAAGAAVGVGLGIAAKIGFDEFKQGALVTAQTNAVIKSTGGIANVTAKQIDNLSTSLMSKSGTDDEVIKSGANMLLTFKNIRNEAGRGNDVFSQSTKTLLDMSTALGKDPKNAAIQLGKALNDPIKGITALTRVGVTFTQAQKDSIKAMVDSGDTMGAQKLILKELNSEFGGSAEAAGKTLPGQLNILKETFSNVAGEIVGRFVPPLVQFAKFVGPLVLKALDGIGKVVDQFVAPAFKRVGEVASENWPKIQKIIGDVWDWVKANVFPIVLQLKGILVETFKNIAAVIEDHRAELSKLFHNIGEIVHNLWAVAGPILKLLFVEVLPRAIGIAIDALTLISSIFVKTQNIIKGVISVILGLVDKLLGGFQLLAEGASHIPGIGDKFKGVAQQIDGARQKLRDLNDELNGTKGKDVKVNLVVTVNGQRVAGRGGADGILGTEAYNWAVANPGALAPPMASATGAAKGLKPMILDELALGRSMGLSLMSGYRPGAITSTGHPSLHGVGQAIDMAGSDAQMRAFAYASAQRPGIQEVIYSPIGWSHFGSGFSPITAPSVLRDHYSHVHVGAASGGDGVLGLRSYDRGGWLPTGISLAHNGTGRPERVGGGDVVINFPNYVGSKSELMSWLQNAAQQFKNQNGRTAFG